MTNAFRVEYSYMTESGVGTNTSLTSSTNQLGYVPVASETSVLAYLRKRHPNCDIVIRNIEWK